MTEIGIDAVRLLRDGDSTLTGDAAIAEAASLLRSGEVVAIPTDTVYGLAATLTSDNALGTVFRIKGRERTQTLPVLVPDRDAAERLVRREAGQADTVRLLRLADRFWPGGLTVALPARAGLPADVLAADGTVGLRVPDIDVTRQLLRLAGEALVVTSANRSGAAPLTDAGAVIRELAPAGLRWVLDAGPSGLAVASTVIGQRDGELIVHRHGAVPDLELKRAWLEIADPADGAAR